VSGQVYAPAASTKEKEPSLSTEQEAGRLPEPVVLWSREESLEGDRN